MHRRDLARLSVRSTDADAETRRNRRTNKNPDLNRNSARTNRTSNQYPDPYDDRTANFNTTARDCR